MYEEYTPEIMHDPYKMRRHWKHRIISAVIVFFVLLAMPAVLEFSYNKLADIRFYSQSVISAADIDISKATVEIEYMEFVSGIGDVFHLVTLENAELMSSVLELCSDTQHVERPFFISNPAMIPLGPRPSLYITIRQGAELYSIQIFEGYDFSRMGEDYYYYPLLTFAEADEGADASTLKKIAKLEKRSGSATIDQESYYALLALLEQFDPR